jgi:hypothetical protein
MQTLAELRLGIGAAAQGGRLLDGWAQPEDGFVWATGAHSRLELDATRLPPDGEALLELDVNPFVLPGSTTGQRLAVSVAGVAAGEDRVVGEGTLGYTVPPGVLRGPGPVTVTLSTPDAARPADLGAGTDRRALAFMVRGVALRHVPAARAAARRVLPPLPLPAGGTGEQLGAALRAATGLAADTLMGGYESLGHNCEFGMAQRHCGAEPLGLLRFSGITLPDLLRALEARFDRLGDTAQTEILVACGRRREFIVRDTRHRLSLHTRRFADETTAERIRPDALRHLAFLGRLFAEALALGEKTFVFQRPGQTLLAQMRPLLARLRAHGPARLLFVVEGHAHAPGTVEELGHGLFRGWTDRMAPQEEVGDGNIAAWVSICANAQRLRSVQEAGA